MPTLFRPRHRRGFLASAVAALALASTLPALSPSAGAATTARITLSSNVSYQGALGKHGATAVSSFTRFRGSPGTVVMDYLGSSSWASISESSWMGQRWKGTSYHLVLSMPILPKDGSTIKTGATGAYNKYFVATAKDLVAGGLADATIRPGWEMTGPWFPWEATHDPASYAGYFRQIVTAMRSVAGARFTFDYSFSQQDRDPNPSYPGDTYVDSVGVDQYDSVYGVDFAPTDHAKLWNHHLTKPYGFTWLAAWAAQHHKRITFPEWSLVKRCDGHGGNDDPYYVDRMRAWVDSHDVAYEIYFDDNDNSCKRFKISDTSVFPLGGAEYKKLWSARQLPRLPTSLIKISSSSDRSGSLALSGLTVGPGRRYITVAAPSGTAKVSFWLDAEYSATPRHVDTGGAPYDLVGGSTAAATAFDTSTLTSGGHTITVKVTSATGVVSTSTASFFRS